MTDTQDVLAPRCERCGNHVMGAFPVTSTGLNRLRVDFCDPNTSTCMEAYAADLEFAADEIRRQANRVIVRTARYGN